MRRNGFTLVEIITVLIIMSVAAVVVMPVVSVLLMRVEDSQSRRSSVSQLHTAIDQVTRTVREWPAEHGVLSSLVVTRDTGDVVGLEVSGAGGFRLDGTDLMLITETRSEGLLCEGVESLEIIATGARSADPLVTDEELAECVTLRVVIRADGVEISALVFIRSMGRLSS